MGTSLLHLPVAGPAYATPGWGESFTIMVVGFLLVVVVLALLSLATALVGRVFELSAKQQYVRDRSVTQLKVRTGGDELDEQRAIAAAIAAAVHVYLEGKSHRILSITRNPAGWAQEGRRQIFSSHRIR